MFADTTNNPYLATVYSIINNVRYQGLPFANLQILAEGHQVSERIIRSMMMLDANYFVYAKDYQKFLGSYQQAAFSGVQGAHGSHARPAASATTGTSQAYY